MGNILYEKQGPISIVTINRPEVMNALDSEASLELGRVWEDFRVDPTARVAILTGAGSRAFCVGADLRAMKRRGEGGDPYRPQQEEAMRDGPYGPRKTYMRAYLKGIPIWKPIIAAINGHAIATGACMILGTDIRIASPNATFCYPEVTFNQLADGGALPRLPRQVPYVHAMKLLLFGERVGAEEALRMGLINEIVPQERLLPRAMELAQKLAALGPEGVQMTKQAVLKGLSVGLDEAMLLESLYAEMIAAFKGEHEHTELANLASDFVARKGGRRR